MLHHNNIDFKGDLDWENITSILKKFNVKYVVVGDNDHVGHTYSWVELQGIKYIHTGIAHNFYNPNINTFLEMQIYDDTSIKFITHTIDYDALSEVYKLNKISFLHKEEKCNYSQEHKMKLNIKERIYCKYIYFKNYIF